MNELQKAALTRAYRTLAQGLSGSTFATALTAAMVALIEGNDQRTTLIVLAGSVVTTLVAAFQSYWMGISQGLPEVTE